VRVLLVAQRSAVEKGRTELDVAVEAEEVVAGLDIVVNRAGPVEGLKALAVLVADGRDLTLGHWVCGDNVGE
jgi:hypothetical protein